MRKKVLKYRLLLYRKTGKPEILTLKYFTFNALKKTDHLKKAN